MTRTNKQVHDEMTECSSNQTIQFSELDSMLALTMKDPTSSPSSVRRGASTKSSVWSTSCVVRSATVGMANISSSVELITSNSKKRHIASRTRELTTSSTAHPAMPVTTSQHVILVAVMYWTCHSVGWRSSSSAVPLLLRRWRLLPAGTHPWPLRQRQRLLQRGGRRLLPRRPQL